MVCFHDFEVRETVLGVSTLGLEGGRVFLEVRNVRREISLWYIFEDIILSIVINNHKGFGLRRIGKLKREGSNYCLRFL